MKPVLKPEQTGITRSVPLLPMILTTEELASFNNQCHHYFERNYKIWIQFMFPQIRKLNMQEYVKILSYIEN